MPAIARSVAATLLIALSIGPATPAAAAVVPSRIHLGVTRIATGLSKPLLLTNAGDGSGRLVVVEQTGRIRIIKGGKLLTAPFLDLSASVSGGNEQGLLGLAFHPGYRSNGKLYVSYTDRNGTSIVREYRVSGSNPDRVNGSSGRTLLRLRQPYANHNGGNIAFGPDGDLYVGFGDGGSAGDPGNRAQNLGTLFGKLLRIDVNRRTGTLPYGIPPTNLFSTWKKRSNILACLSADTPIPVSFTKNSRFSPEILYPN